MVLKKLIGVLILGLFLIGTVSAWDVEITKLNGENITNPAYYGKYIEEFSYVASGDNISDSNISNVCWTYNDSTGIKTECDPTTPHLIDTLEISSIQGNNSIFVNITLKNNESETASQDFWVDSIAPNLTYVQPWGPMHFTNQDSFDFQFWLNETNKGTYDTDNFAPFFLQVTKPNSLTGPFSQPTLGNLSSSDKTLSEIKTVTPSETDLKEGEYTWIAFAKDKYPNETKIREVNITGTIIRDVTDPNVWFNAPANNSNVSGFIWVNASAKDANFPKNITLNLSNSTNNYLIDYCEFSVDCNSNWDSSTVADGQYTITATAYDKAGNTNSTSRIINIDNHAPLVEFMPSTNSSGIYYLNQTIFVNASDAAGNLDTLSILVNGSLVENCVGQSECNYTLSDGDYTVKALANDTLGNENQTEERDFLIDTIDPFLSLNLSNDSVEYGIENITINLFLEDINILEMQMNLTNSTGDVLKSQTMNNETMNVSYEDFKDNFSYFLINDSSENNEIPTDTFDIGNYSLIISAKDIANNSVIVSENFSVVDNTLPMIELKEDNPQTIEVFGNYIELNATATDNYDEDLTNNITINSSSVNTNILGDYNVSYFVEDSFGNNVTTYRNVSVVDTTIPVINLNEDMNGDKNVSLERNVDLYTELNATATDNYDEDLTNNITINSSSVNTNLTGNYSVTYDVVDSSGNSANQIIRNVEVVDTIAPIIDINLSNVTVSNIGENTATITWDTSEESNSIVFYDTNVSASEPENNKSNSNFVNNHSITLEGLDDGTLYYYAVMSCDKAGNCNQTYNRTDVNFTTKKHTSPPRSPGGSGSSSSCDTVWKCDRWDKWSLCDDGIQVRNCLEYSKVSCGDGVEKSEIDAGQNQSCALNVISASDSETTEDESDIADTEKDNFISTITGGAIGFARTKTGLMTIVVTGLALVGLIFTGIKKGWFVKHKPIIHHRH